MKPRPTQFGVRENTASSRQHASTLAASPSFHKSGTLALSGYTDRRSPEQMSPTRETFNLSLIEPAKEATGEEKRGTGNPANVAHRHGEQCGIELGLRSNLRTVSKSQIDLQSTAAALERDMRVVETDEPKQAWSNLP